MIESDMAITLRFSESVSDFGSLIIEHDAYRVWRALREAYPEQAEALKKAILAPTIPRLFKAP